MHGSLRSGRGLADDFLGVLVVAQPEVAGVAEPAVAGSLGEADLGDQLGGHEGLPRVLWSVIERAGPPLALLE